MKKELIIILLIFVNIGLFSENTESENYYRYITYYYIQKDKRITDFTINFLNSNPQIEDKQQLKLAAFHIALFDDQQFVKEKFESKIESFHDNKKIIEYALQTDIDTFLEERQITSTWNDIFWNMFFATGKLEYIDHLIETTQYNEQREDLILFMAGASAKWSIASNIQQHNKIEEYIINLVESQPGKYNFLKELLTLDLSDFRQKTVDILKDQKEKGIW